MFRAIVYCEASNGGWNYNLTTSSFDELETAESVLDSLMNTHDDAHGGDVQEHIPGIGWVIYSPK